MCGESLRTSRKWAYAHVAKWGRKSHAAPVAFCEPSSGAAGVKLAIRACHWQFLCQLVAPQLGLIGGFFLLTPGQLQTAKQK